MSLRKFTYPEAEDYPTDDGAVIALLMKQKNVDQKTLAKLLDVSQPLLSKIMAGQRWINRELERRIVALESTS